MNIIILGGDGYLGWATAMRFSASGHDVTVVDNYMKRKLQTELKREPLVKQLDLQGRADVWQAVSGKKIKVQIGDVTDYPFLLDLVRDEAPDTIVHYAEQPSAPYSMMDRSKAWTTLQNNILSTLNVVYAIREGAPGCHIVKLGTMGEYGTPNIDIEEGFIDITHKGREDRLLFPKTPGSIYHLSKVNDSDLLYFACRTWGLAVTDLNQGPVYGVFTEESKMDERLNATFSYDDIFGTVLNRFVTQAVVGEPLTVYGKGGQVRGYLNIKDTIQCVELAAKEPAPAGEFRVLNQFSETFSVNQLADRVVRVAKDLGHDACLKHIDNPRKEAEEHYYNPQNTGLLDLGLKPHILTDEVIANMLNYVNGHAKAITRELATPQVKWSGGKA